MIKNIMLSKRNRIFAGLVIALFLFSGYSFFRSDFYFEVSKNIDIFTRVFKEIAFNYVDEINPGEFLRAGIKGMLSTLDPYTTFIDEKHQDDIEFLTKGKYGGIGISVGVRDNRVIIAELIDGYSAQRQGIRIGDILFKVNEVLVTPENYDEISANVKGEPGTFVNIKVLRGKNNDTINFDLVREEVIIKNVPFYDFVPANSNNAYIKLTGFTRSAGEEVKQAILNLKKKKEIKSIVLDLRYNPGGLLESAVEVSNKFLKKGDLVVTTKGRDTNNVRRVFAEQEALLPNIPLVVLVNGSSASASEIVAGAIQDHDRGVIVGTKSFGKGLVQTVTPLSYNTSIKLTSARYYTPSGRTIQKIDYAKNNKVINRKDSMATASFKTTHNRTVYSLGGINPDSTVVASELSEYSINLMAQGVLFKFANRYFEQNSKKSFESIKKEEVFAAFVEFIESNKIETNSALGNEYNLFIEKVKKNKSVAKLSAKMESIKTEIDELSKNGLNDCKEEIIDEIMIELAARYKGNEGRINELLKYDPQFKAALEILLNSGLYHKIINN